MTEKYEEDVDELHQVDDDGVALRPIPVTVEGPVTVRPAPAIDGALGSMQVTATTAEVISDGDPRRARLVLLSATEPIRLATSRDAVRSSNAAWWPAGVPLEIRHRAPVWALCATAGQETAVTVAAERWAD